VAGRRWREGWGVTLYQRPREDDERLLHMLRMRDRGMTARQCGAPYGIPPEKVRTIFQRIDIDTARAE
jgi:hypothetical protein